MNGRLLAILGILAIITSEVGGTIWSREIGLETKKTAAIGALGVSTGHDSKRPSRGPRPRHAEICLAHEYTVLQPLNAAAALRMNNLHRDAKTPVFVNVEFSSAFFDVIAPRIFDVPPDNLLSWNADVRLVAPSVRPHAPPTI